MSSKRSRISAFAIGALIWAGAALAPAAAQAGTANAGIAGAPSTNPIAGLTWGYYTGNVDEIYWDYQAATGAERQLLGEVAMRPEAYWFGNWENDPKAAAASYIASVTQGNPNVLAQLTDFGIGPWEDKACGKTPSGRSVASFKRWTAGFASGIGDSRALVVEQPDLPVADAGCIPHGARKFYLEESTYAAQKLDALKHTTVYLDAGASDWLSPSRDAALLLASGIKYARGFALDATHYASTEQQILFGKELVAQLAKDGAPGKHFIVDTSENGSPFTHQQYTNAGGNPKNWAYLPGCKKLGTPRFCQTFGIPPTWQTNLSQWHLGTSIDKLAAEYVDGYVWFGRPWMKGQSAPFDPSLTMHMAKSTPFPYPKYGEPAPAEATDDLRASFGSFGSKPGERIKT